jgi:hypothetical protein
MGNPKAANSRKSWEATTALPVNSGYETMTYSCMAYVPSKIPHVNIPIRTSGTNHKTMASEDQQHKNSPSGTSMAPGIKRGIQNSRAVLPFGDFGLLVRLNTVGEWCTNLCCDCVADCESKTVQAGEGDRLMKAARPDGYER